MHDVGKRTENQNFSQADAGVRLDKWLFHARIFKSRGLAVQRIERGGIRLNGRPCRKASQMVRPGDQLTVSANGQVRGLQIVAVGTRRGPPAEARMLYKEVSDGLIDSGEDTR